ncbi:cell division protein FtsL [Amphibiibacter pelophylacis]|uniref:Cell division protein FtsL n=1 Tax=Amphibiibacter pelophylacis TaxID=1799477 RepID=A0ACC6P5E6_9BURK
MTRNLFVLAVLVGASMMLVVSTHRARTVFAELQQAKAVQRQLDVQYRRLEAARQQLSKNLAVERLAQTRLQMRAATPEVTEYVRQTAAAGARP